jgi:hypothetical protein
MKERHLDYLRRVSRTIDGFLGVIRCAALVGALVAPAAPAYAAIVGSAVDNGDGTFTYSFVVDNSSGSFDIAAWALDFAFATPDWDQLDTLAGGGVTVPDPNWVADIGIPVTGLSAQDFLSLSPDSDVLVGAMLAGFSFTSAYQPGEISYSEFSAFGDSAIGSTVGPSSAPIPEARALWTFPIGLALLAFAVRRNSLRATRAN